MGRRLKATEEWWIERAFIPSQQECITFALEN